MSNFAYRLGCRAARLKFGGAADAPANDGASSYDSSGSPVPTTSFHGMQQAIDQAFLSNAAQGATSAFTDPGNTNNILQGGPPGKPFSSDTSGGLS